MRNPFSVRPYQHVLEPLMAYLMIARRQYEDPRFAGCYNVGPEDQDCVTTGSLVSLFCEKWKDGSSWENRGDNGPHEAGFLKLDCSRLKHVYGWRPVWNVEQAIEKTVEWYQEYLSGGDVAACMERQIQEYLAGEKAWK